MRAGGGDPFFIVPDVCLSLVGRRLATGLWACLFALGGALAGGALIYFWGAHDKPGAVALMEYLPAISPAMVQRVEAELATRGVGAILAGPLSGTPYKLCAAQAAKSGIGFAAFLLVSIPARVIRFVLITTGVHDTFRLIAAQGIAGRPTLLILGCWVLFYVFYFTLMPG